MNLNRHLLIGALAIALGACASKKVEPTDTTPVRTTTPPVVEQPRDDGRFTSTDLDNVPCLIARVVYFDFDQSEIKGEFSEILGCHAKYLRDNPSARITLEGHADERGTREYNLGLGERRGNAVRDRVIAQGGGSNQTSTVSYGEERPTCNDANEGCWSRNRRVEIVYTAK